MISARMQSVHRCFLASLLIFSGCVSSSLKRDSDGLTDTPNSEKREEKIAIVGTNDIHGSLTTSYLKTREKSGHPVLYPSSSVAVMASYIKILKSEWKDHLIWLDGGDQFQGSVESNFLKGSPVVSFFNHVGLSASAIGNHEFDFGIDELKLRMKEAKFPYVASNITEKPSGKRFNSDTTKSHVILKAGNLKIGVIGLITMETPVTSAQQNIENLEFEDLRKATLREAKELRNEGANIILLTAHAGLSCLPHPTFKSPLLKKPTDPQGQCGGSDEMVNLLYSLPEGTVDAVIAGHTHQVVNQWIAGVPVIEAGVFGRYLNVIYLTYDWAQKRVIPDQTRIEGPIPVCEKVFQNQKDCNGDLPPPKGGRGPLVSPYFHNVKVTPDPEMLDILEPVQESLQTIKSRHIGIATRPLDHTHYKESTLGNIASDAIREAVHADVSFMNPEGVRASIESGAVLYGDVFRASPFDNIISIAKVNGKELMNLLKAAECGFQGVASVSGISLTMIHPRYKAPFEDFNKTGVYDFWKVNRIVKVSFPNGEPIRPTQMYSVAFSDYLATGGDGFAWVMSQIPKERVQLNSGMLVRDALASWIERNSPVDPTEVHSRIHLVAPQAQKVKGLTR